MRKLVIFVLVAAVIGGCNIKDQQKIEAYQRWHRTRASVMTSLGNEHFKVGELDKAKSSATEALALDKTCVAARTLLAKVFLEKGRYAEAAEEMQKAEKYAPDNAEVPYLLGVALEKRRQYAEALKAYQKARALDPSNDAYVSASAEALVAWGKPRLALELLETRLERTDGNLRLLALAGELATMVGEPAKAAGFYQRYLDLNPKNLAAREGLAKSLYFAGKHAEALEALAELAEHEEHRDKTSWVYIMLGDCHLALNRPPEARRAYQTAARIEPGEPRVWSCLAKAAAAAGDADYAALAAQRALALKEDDPEARLALAYAMMIDGKSGEAAKILTDQNRKRPEDATALCMLGRCYASMGRREQAVSCYVQALRSDPQHRLAKKLLASADLQGGGPR